jgi:hypothetical protein
MSKGVKRKIKSNGIKYKYCELHFFIFNNFILYVIDIYMGYTLRPRKNGKLLKSIMGFLTILLAIVCIV